MTGECKTDVMNIFFYRKMMISQLACRSILSRMTRYSNGKERIKFMSTENSKVDTKNNAKPIQNIGKKCIIYLLSKSKSIYDNF